MFPRASLRAFTSNMASKSIEGASACAGHTHTHTLTLTEFRNTRSHADRTRTRTQTDTYRPYVIAHSSAQSCLHACAHVYVIQYTLAHLYTHDIYIYIQPYIYIHTQRYLAITYYYQTTERAHTQRHHIIGAPSSHNLATLRTRRTGVCRFLVLNHMRVCVCAQCEM